MPLWENYDVEVHVEYTIRAGGKVIAYGKAPGDGKDSSNVNVGHKGILGAFDKALKEAAARAEAAVFATSALRRKALGYGD